MLMIRVETACVEQVRQYRRVGQLNGGQKGACRGVDGNPVAALASTDGTQARDVRRRRKVIVNDRTKTVDVVAGD